ncbi:MAG: dihydropteroate synthase [Deltaproteobacteria bacterium]|nr:dihydropteroate synthase [Deltaproteobacteria bacterium]
MGNIYCRDLLAAIGKPPPWIVGVLNITPDSFSDGGLYVGAEAALSRARELLADGADIIDIGGESTGPGAKPIASSVELERILSVVSVLAKEAFVSIDTYKAATAKECLRAGARMINDVSALRADSLMSRVISESDAFVVLMHSKEDGARPHASESKCDYVDIIPAISAFLKWRIDFAISQGISRARIVVDPGMGRFLSHDSKYSWELLRRLGELGVELKEFPLMVGTSRKGFLGKALGEREPISQLTGLISFLKGASLIRTHNVSMAREFFDVWKSLMPIS